LLWIFIVFCVKKNPVKKNPRKSKIKVIFFLLLCNFTSPIPFLRKSDLSIFRIAYITLLM
jgi:hypothetical protein